jgi:hypothetical protein
MCRPSDASIFIYEDYTRKMRDIEVSWVFHKAIVDKEKRKRQFKYPTPLFENEEIAQHTT